MFGRRLLMQQGASVIAPTLVIPLTSAGHGGWLEVNGPQAAYASGKTFITYVKDGGDVCVVSYDHATETVSSETTVDAAVDDDTHVTPSIIVRSDGKVVVFYSGHESAELWMAVSTSAGDISAFDSPVNLDSQLGTTSYTYTTCIELDDAFYLFFRCVAGGTKWAYSVSTDNMATWSGAATLYYNSAHNRAYLKMNGGGSRIDFMGLTEHPDQGTGSVEHFYLTDSGGTPSFFDSAGGSLSRPITEGQATTVHSGARSALGDVLYDGQPYLLYGVNAAAGDGRMRWGTYSGGWSTEEVTDGANYFSDYLMGGAAFLSATEVVVSVNQEIVKFTRDGTWTERPHTSGSSLDHVFPKPVHDGVSGMRAVWLYGTLDSTGTTWSLAINGLP